MYGRQTKNAIAIMSRLAEVYDEDVEVEFGLDPR